MLFATAFLAAFAGTAGLTLRAAERRAADAPAESRRGRARAEKPEKSAEEREPLRLSVDRHPIDRNAPDRVSYAPIVNRTASSVVYVYSSKTVRGRDLSPLLNDPMLRRFFNLPESDGDSPRGRAPERTQEGLGSGVIITADGYILTNNHIVEGADEVKVSVGESNKRYDARVVGRDPGADIAVLKIEATGLVPATFGDSEQLQVGDVVLAIGNPFGVGQSVSRGIVSALGRGVGMEMFEDFIQTDAAINPGNSGGALLDSQGRLVGVNTAILSRSGGFAGVGFAIPSNLVRNIAEQIVNTGRVERGFLGVRLQYLSEELSAQFGAEKGALISEVTVDSPAEQGGLEAGDVITRVNQTAIRDTRQLLITVSQIAPESEVAVEYVRDRRTHTTTITLGRRPEEFAGDETAPGAKDEGVLNGVHIDDISPEGRAQIRLPARFQGVIITRVEPDSPSAKQGLRDGDVILELNRKSIADAREAVQLSEEIKGPTVLVLIWREGRTQYLVIDESK